MDPPARRRVPIDRDMLEQALIWRGAERTTYLDLRTGGVRDAATIGSRPEDWELSHDDAETGMAAGAARVNEQQEVLRIVAERLTTSRIPYMLTGSVALNHYTIPRMTRAIDVVAELVVADSDRVCQLFPDDFYVDHDAVRSAIETQGMFNLIHLTLVMKLDVIVRKDSKYRRTEFESRRRVSVEEQEIFIVAPEDLILSKLDWARDSRSAVQLDDVRGLLTSVHDLDRRYLAEWAMRLDLESLYREVGE